MALRFAEVPTRRESRASMPVMSCGSTNPAVMEILRYTLWRLERTVGPDSDDPALVAVRRQIVGKIAELELSKDPTADSPVAGPDTLEEPEPASEASDPALPECPEVMWLRTAAALKRRRTAM